MIVFVRIYWISRNDSSDLAENSLSIDAGIWLSETTGISGLAGNVARDSGVAELTLSVAAIILTERQIVAYRSGKGDCSAQR
jgi:hypothetical protein